MYKSRGMLKDLAILDTAVATLKITKENMEDTSRKDDNSKHLINKKIDRRIDTMHDNLKGMYNDLSDDEVQFVSKYRKKIMITLSKLTVSEPISYEYLGGYILFHNFFGNKSKIRKIDTTIQNYIDKNQLFDTLELVSLTGTDDNGLECLLSKKLLERI